MIKICLVLAGYSLFSIFSIKAQVQPDYQFGKISPGDFNITPEKVDSGANAIILEDVGKLVYEENEVKEFDMVMKRYTRVKIINQNGFDAGKFALLLRTLVPYNSVFVKLAKPGLVSLKGSTYNLENGIIKETKLDPASVVTEKLGKNLTIEKFAMPALQAGSVFDIEYTTRTAYLVQNPDWYFQSTYPCHWSEYELTLPHAEDYTVKYQGDTTFDIRMADTVQQLSEGYSYHQKLSMSHFMWAKKNVPAFTQEPFINSWKNYVNRVSIKHRWFIISPMENINVNSSSWKSFSRLYFLINGLDNFEDEKYGWLKSDLQPVTAGLKTKDELSKAIFKYVRDHYKCTKGNSYFTSQTLRETFTSKTGNLADINLLLTAMLHYVHIDADPAVLSTTENGFGNLNFPIAEEYNYLICAAHFDGRNVLLDASQPLNSYNKLMPYCYNGGAVTLNTKDPKLIGLDADSLVESNRTSVIISADEKGVLSASMTENCGFQKAFSIRKELKDKSLKEYFNTLFTNSQITALSNEEVDSIDNPDKPLSIHCDLDFKKQENAETIYLSPVVLSQFEKNPFIATDRKYAIEMPFRMDNIYLASLDIPKGYRVEEMPSSQRILLNNNDGIFDYIIEKNADDIQLKIRMKLNRTFFRPEEYTALREFISNVIKKENEIIVFKKTGS
jgi:Domain of Unknown Function with PDB structure (DUF3858)